MIYMSNFYAARISEGGSRLLFVDAKVHLWTGGWLCRRSSPVHDYTHDRGRYDDGSRGAYLLWPLDAQHRVCAFSEKEGLKTFACAGSDMETVRTARHRRADAVASYADRRNVTRR